MTRQTTAPRKAPERNATSSTESPQSMDLGPETVE